MGWLWAWLQQITGPPQTDPWHDDPHIAAERRGQHTRINRASEGSYYDQWNARVRRGWDPEVRQDDA